MRAIIGLFPAPLKKSLDAPPFAIHLISWNQASPRGIIVLSSLAKLPSIPEIHLHISEGSGGARSSTPPNKHVGLEFSKTPFAATGLSGSPDDDGQRKLHLSPYRVLLVRVHTVSRVAGNLADLTGSRGSKIHIIVCESLRGPL